QELELLLEQLRPATLLSLLGDEEPPPALRPYQAEALWMLDRDEACVACLKPVLAELTGDALAYGQRLWAETKLHAGALDAAILAAQHASQASARGDLRAAALAWSAVGYARKHCWKLAEEAIGRALAIDPLHPVVWLAQARVRLAMD